MTRKYSLSPATFFVHVFLILFLSAILANCSSEKKKSQYLRWVGDIEADESIDDPSFKLCSFDASTKQYFNFSQGLQYEGEMLRIRKEFFSAYKPVSIDQSGLIRIRFLINCRGESGRFRMIMSDKNYRPMVFDVKITKQLMNITKNLNGWKPLPALENPKDYYQYLIFKIENGNLIEILP